MKCSKCQSENPQEAKFCGKCGAKLSLVCTQCGYENTPGNNFCIECGHNLTIPSEQPPKDLSFDEKIDKIQRYLPKGLTEKILAQRDRIEGERKQVTVMFCDMEGFTQAGRVCGKHSPKCRGFHGQGGADSPHFPEDGVSQYRQGSEASNHGELASPGGGGTDSLPIRPFQAFHARKGMSDLH